MPSPEVRYAWNGDVSIAHQVTGTSSTDLVYLAGWMSNIEAIWEMPEIAGFLRHLASFSRLITLDKRGSGLSSHVLDVPNLETGMDDLRAVLDAVGSERAVLVALSIDAALASLFAATYPERTLGIVFIHGIARAAWAPDYTFGETLDEYEEETERIRKGWGTGEFERWFIGRVHPEKTIDDAAVASTARYFRLSMSPGEATLANRIWWETDFRHVLPSIHVPALVISRRRDPAIDQDLADRIPGAVLAPVVEPWRLSWLPGSEPTAAEVEKFVRTLREEEDLDRVLATVLFTDIVDSTALAATMGDKGWREVMDSHDRIVRGQLARYRGRAVKTMGDGFLAVFDGPARAIRCAAAIAAAVRPLGIEVRAGLHTGEIVNQGRDVAGIAVTIGARVGALAEPGEVLVSSTVMDLTAGSGLTFEEAGERVLKGVPGRWRLYRGVAPLTPSSA